MATFAGDVTRYDSATKLVADVSHRLGPPTVLVNNVGEFTLSPVAATSAQRWQEVIDSNLSSAFYMTKAVLSAMRKMRRGRIINVGLAPTGYLARGAPNIAAYAVAKMGIAVLTRSVAVEEAAYG